MIVNNRILYLSRLKALACIGVIILHVFSSSGKFAVSQNQMTLLLSVKNCMSWAVPCFVMASGALLLDRKRTLTPKKLFGKYIFRMVITLVVFSLLFSVFDTFTTAKRSVGETVKDTLSDIFLGTGWPHMWYLYLMIAVYLMLPIYKIISTNAEPKDLNLLAVYGIGLSVLPFIETITGKKLPFYICVFTIYPLYLFLGHVLHTGAIRLPKNASGLMFLISLGIVAMLTVYSCNAVSESPETAGKINALLTVYSFPVYIAAAVGAYGYFRKTKNKPIAAAVGAYGYFRKTKNKPVPVLDSIAAELDSCSFGIYLIHMAVLKFIYAVLKFNPFNNGGTIAVIGVCIVTLAVSYVITKLLKFVPYVKTII